MFLSTTSPIGSRNGGGRAARRERAFLGPLRIKRKLDVTAKY